MENYKDFDEMNHRSILLPEDLPYQDIYDDVEAELNVKTFTQSELFHHCIQTCHRIFELSEYRYGHPPKDIPHDLIEELAFLYSEKRYRCSFKGMPTEKYDYPTSSVNYPEGNFSISDLAKILSSRNSDSNDKQEKYLSLWKMNDQYMSKFFGVAVSDSSDNSERYECIRLLKILYDCIRECEIDLGYVIRMSLMKQTTKIPNSYSKALNFIKERILLRSVDSEYRIHFETVMYLEKYNNAVRSFINSFAEGIIEYAIAQINNPSCQSIRFICENIFRAVLVNISKLESSAPVPKHKPEDKHKPEGIQCYAYEHFLMTDINQSDYPDFYSKIFVVEADDTFYIHSKKFLECYVLNQVNLDDIGDFAYEYKRLLTKIINPDIKSSDASRKFEVRIERHKDEYAVIGRIYNLGLERNEDHYLSGLETLSVIYLYEFLSDKEIDIPLYSGYNVNKKRRDLKIKNLTKKIKSRWENKALNAPLSDEEYYLACYWITEQMYLLTHYRTVEIQTLREQMKTRLLKYWHESHLLITESGYIVNLEELINTIIPITQRDEIIEKAMTL